jgi:hypothetical protein
MCITTDVVHGAKGRKKKLTISQMINHVEKGPCRMDEKARKWRKKEKKKGGKSASMPKNMPLADDDHNHKCNI